jgi:hypothetical protein
MELTPNREPSWPLEVDRIADFLDLGVVWDRIPSDDYGPIAARILPLHRQIELNEEILSLPEGFQSSTLAHEIGHWMLHINYAEVEYAEVEEGGTSYVSSSDDSFLCRPNSSLTELESIEWQAQYFASCLLMPENVLLEYCDRQDLTRWSTLYQLRDRLGVTISNLVNRLQDLGWIHIPQGSRKLMPGPVNREEATKSWG